MGITTVQPGGSTSPPFVGTALFCKGGIDLNNITPNYTIQMAAQMSSLSVTDAYVGVLARSDNISSYYGAYIRADGQFRLVKVVAGVETLLDSGSFTIAIDTDYTISLRVLGDLITAVLPGELTLEATDTELTQADCPGFIISRSSSAVDFTIINFNFFGDVTFCDQQFTVTEEMVFTESGGQATFVSLAEETNDSLADSPAQAEATLVSLAESADGLSDVQSQITPTLVSQTEVADGLSDVQTQITPNIVTQTEPSSGISDVESAHAGVTVAETETYTPTEAETVVKTTDQKNITDDLTAISDSVTIVTTANVITFPDEATAQLAISFIFSIFQEQIAIVSTEKIFIKDVAAIGIPFTVNQPLGIGENLDLIREIQDSLAITDSVAKEQNNLPAESLNLVDSVRITIENDDLTTGYQEPDVIYEVSKDRVSFAT